MRMPDNKNGDECRRHVLRPAGKDLQAVRGIAVILPAQRRPPSPFFEPDGIGPGRALTRRQLCAGGWDRSRVFDVPIPRTTQVVAIFSLILPAGPCASPRTTDA